MTVTSREKPEAGSSVSARRATSAGSARVEDRLRWHADWAEHQTEPQGDCVIVNRYCGSKQPDEYDELEQHLVQNLNTPLDWPEDGGLTVSHVANIASAATCDSAYSRAANGHLIDLFAALPLPGTPEGSTFWRRILDAAGEAAWNIVPARGCLRSPVQGRALAERCSRSMIVAR
ncbi:hypothetical protein GCM10010349_77410 [Streptomyces flavofungini]|nr:hypothetical protein GCM10010349_77410 [Streptomyces flavofungini]